MFLSKKQVAAIGFRNVGDDVLIDEAAIFIGAERLSIGSKVRIDAHTIISCPKDEVRVGSHVHLAVGVLLYCGGGVELEDFVGLSPRTTVFSETDDFLEGYLTGPTVPAKFRKVTSGPVRFGRHVIVGAGSVILPGVQIGKGAAVGAMSLVTKDVEPFAIVHGVPAKRAGTRNRARLEELEAQLRQSTTA